MAKRRGRGYVAGQNTVTMSIDTSSLDDLVASLDGSQGDAVTAAVAAGAKVIYELAQENVSKLTRSGAGTGNLYASIYRKYVEELSSPGVKATYHVSWRTSRGSGLPRAPHGHLLEYGWIMKYHRFQDPKTGEWKTDKNRPLATPKQMPAKRFMRDAIERGADKAVAVMEETFVNTVLRNSNEP